ncbi:MAG: hypothetical protein JWQ71_2124 [Pedosphaera sp.]|nr:hypothetical protein [Pedosphaera sp.]
MKEKNMNDKRYKRLPTRFAPETRFEVKTVPFRATETTELENLKNRLLLQFLNQVTDPEQNVLLRRAANDAAALAWATCFPLLFFPTLLEEKARATELQLQRQKQVRERSLNLALEAA